MHTQLRQLHTAPADACPLRLAAQEIFEPNHRTAPHVHKAAHELFFVLAGEGQGFAGGKRFPLRAGDCAVFPPGVVHGIDNLPADDVGSGGSSGGSKGGRLYCLQVWHAD